MGRKKPKPLNTEKKHKNPYPSEYGSHKSMVIPTPPEIRLESHQVLCQDQLGPYVTEKTRLDNGMADPNRYSPRKNPRPLKPKTA